MTGDTVRRCRCVVRRTEQEGRKQGINKLINRGNDVLTTKSNGRDDERTKKKKEEKKKKKKRKE